MRVILLPFRKHLHDRIISLKGKVWAHRAILTQPHLIEIPVSSQESGRSYICAINILKIAELDCWQIIILSIYVPSTHAYTHVLRLSLDLPYETR